MDDGQAVALRCHSIPARKGRGSHDGCRHGNYLSVTADSNRPCGGCLSLH